MPALCPPPDAGEQRLRHRLLRAGGRGLAGPDRDFRVPLLSRPADLVDIDDANRPAGWIPISPSAARTDAGHRRIFRPRGDRAGRAGRARAGDRLAGKTRSTPSSSMCRARRGCSMTDGIGPARHLCGQVRPALHRSRPDAGRSRRNPARRGHDAVDPRLVRATSRPRRRDSLAEPLLHLLPRGARSTIRRSVRSPRRRCR